MITAQQALSLLVEGNERFVTGQIEAPHRELEHLAELATLGQSPFATILCCCDSRCPPELLFDQGFGDLFTIRVAGNVVAVNETGSVEYGVEHLATPLVVVLGHTGCGAVTAAVRGGEESRCITEIMDLLKLPVSKALSEHPGANEAEMVGYAVEENVLHSIERLFCSSPIISRQTREGKLEVIGAVFDLATGRVKWLGHPTGQRMPPCLRLGWEQETL